jgi:hypothetical protein
LKATRIRMLPMSFTTSARRTKLFISEFEWIESLGTQYMVSFVARRGATF